MPRLLSRSPIRVSSLGSTWFRDRSIVHWWIAPSSINTARFPVDLIPHHVQVGLAHEIDGVRAVEYPGPHLHQLPELVEPHLVGSRHRYLIERRPERFSPRGTPRGPRFRRPRAGPLPGASDPRTHRDVQESPCHTLLTLCVGTVNHGR